MSFQPKQHSDHVFFLDRCLGRFVVAAALRAIGAAVKVHDDLFEQDSPDSEWLPTAGRHGWVVLTKDRTIKSNQIEIVSLINANIACFNLVAADMTGPEMAQAFVSSMAEVNGILAKVSRPFVANITRSDHVDLLYRRSDLIDRL